MVFIFVLFYRKYYIFKSNVLPTKCLPVISKLLKQYGNHLKTFGIRTNSEMHDVTLDSGDYVLKKDLKILI